MNEYYGDEPYNDMLGIISDMVDAMSDEEINERLLDLGYDLSDIYIYEMPVEKAKQIIKECW